MLALLATHARQNRISFFLYPYSIVSRGVQRFGAASSVPETKFRITNGFSQLARPGVKPG